jgi:5-dehydro-2-deoxygluconokinase
VSAEAFELITMGRVSVDLYPTESGVGLERVRTFKKSLGGSTTNVAVAAARLGARAATITRVGDDPFGRYVVQALRDFGVDPRWVATHPSLRTPLAFCELRPPDEFPILFYREPTAPDMTIALDELDLEAISAAGAFWTSGTGLSAEPSRTATLEALRTRRERSGGLTIHDLDHRPALWADGGDPGALARAAAGSATVLVGNRDEVEVAVGSRDPRRAAADLLALGPELAVVKLGAHGVYARSHTEEVELPAPAIRIVNGLGAGDAFGGALAVGLLRGGSLARVLQIANAAGAHVAARLGCADEMPDRGEIESITGARGLA